MVSLSLPGVADFQFRRRRATGEPTRISAGMSGQYSQQGPKGVVALAVDDDFRMGDAR